MEIHHLKSFQTVARQGHLTQAAEILHLSQPAVTAHIKTLEEELGLALFNRTSSGVQLTDAGRRLLVDAERVLGDVRAMCDHALGMQGQLRGRVRIGTLTVAPRMHLGPLLAEVSRRHPLLCVQTRLGLSRDSLAGMRRDHLDCAFFLGRDDFEGMSTIPLTEIGFCVALPCRLAGKLADADWQGLGSESWLGVSPRSTIAGTTDLVWRTHGIRPRVIGEFDDESVLAEMVKAGVGIALLAERTARRIAADGACALWREGEVVSRSPLQFIYPAERESDPAILAVRESLDVVWRKS